MKLTTKQYELLRVISAGNGPDDPADLDEVLERVRYEASKPGLQFQIRALIAHGLIARRGIVKRRGRQRQVLEATKLGHDYMVTNRVVAADYSGIEGEGLDEEPALVDLSI